MSTSPTLSHFDVRVAAIGHASRPGSRVADVKRPATHDAIADLPAAVPTYPFIARAYPMDRVTSRCVVLALLLLAGAGVDGATIRGVPSCTYWLQDREPGGHSSYFNAMWLVGYLSGAAVHSDKDVLRAVDSESIAVWMDNYCKANASRSVAEGGEALFNEVARRLPADKASNVSLASTSTGKPQSDEAPRPVPPSPSPSVADAPRAPMPAPSTAAADAPRPAMQSTSPAPAEPVPAPTRSP